MSIKYRPEIDGLRAIAVAAVVIYHAEFTIFDIDLFPGGFLGVDVFFVISGFLITSIIAREVEETNKFNYLRFYERRVRRILPALLLIMLISIPFAWFTMHPKALYEFSGSILSSLFFSSNIWFWLENSYTAQASQLKPFLHTWSLSVEEQFYLLFPLLMLLGWRYTKKYIFHLFALVFIVSLIYSELLSQSYTNANFFLLPSRAWELCAGSLLAYIKLNDENLSYRLIKFLPGIGLLMLVVSFLVFTENTPHPSKYTLLPVIGTCLIILFARRNELVTRLLSTPIFIILGLLSYSFYLWHFPVFSFAKIILGNLSTAEKLVLILISLILSYLTYYLIEQPFRRKFITPNRIFYPIVLSLLSLIFIINFGIFFLELKPAKFRKLESTIDFTYDYRAVYREGTCFLSPADMNAGTHFENCAIEGYNSNNVEIMLWGDSHAAHLYPGIQKRYGGSYNIIQRTASLCAPVLGRDVATRPNCLRVNESVAKSIRNSPPKNIILAASWWTGSPKELEGTIRSLYNWGVESVVVIGPAPYWEKGLPELLSEYTNSDDFDTYYLSAGLSKNRLDLDIEFKAYSSDKRWEYVSATDVLCRKDECITRLGPKASQITQWDRGHLTEAGSVYLVKRWGLTFD
ncbi:acyltransferase family protein [Litorimonas haliclonae]|uniref:acyltransferase family protein n=1 Tax=Litorimonas haliclonae TaxID=2081977 RepID=UPI0039F01908